MTTNRLLQIPFWNRMGAYRNKKKKNKYFVEYFQVLQSPFTYMILLGLLFNAVRWVINKKIKSSRMLAFKSLRQAIADY